MKLHAVVAFALISVLSFAQDVKYEKYVLSNGMTVILHEDHSLPVATVNTWYHVGSKDERPRRSGFAHLFEHLMFMGTERAPTGQFDKIMESGGGSNNASTSSDRTNYYDYGPSGLLPTLLWLEADRLEDLGRMMDQKKLDLQREVVKNERRQSYENAPYGMAWLKIYEAMYPDGHPYHISTIGLPEDLDAATVKDVKDFFASYYLPNNATMVVAGDFDSKEIKPLIAKLFGTLPRGNDPIHKTAPEPTLHEVKRLTLVDKVPQARIYMVWHGPAIYKPGDGEMDLIGGVLSDGFSSRLYQRLVVKDQLASDVSASEESDYLGSLFSVVATAKEGVSPEKIENVIDEEIGNLLESGPTPDELSRIKSKYEFATLNGLQSLSDVADRLNQYDFFLSEPNSFRWDLERHLKPTPADVQAWGKKVLTPSARLILRVVPESPKTTQNPRDQRPELKAEGDIKLPSPVSFTLSNGIKGFYWNRPELPLMSVSMMFQGGSASDPAGKSGLASVTAGMLDQGAGDLDADAFSKALDALGASFGAGAGSISSSANLSTTAASFEKALPLFADAIIRPRLDAQDWAREQGLTIDELAQELDDPGSVARLVAMREFFGASHPYGRNSSGTAESIKGLKASDLVEEHKQLFRPENATLFAAGSLSLEQAKASFEKAFGSWKPLAAKNLPVPALSASPPSGLKFLIVDKPDAVQTVIRFVFPGVPYRDPNRMALEGLSTLFGGTFTSRLNANLRESKGYTYGAGARSVFEPGLGYMVADASVRADVTGASLKEFLAEFDKIRTGDVSEAEAISARSSMRTDTIASMNSLGGIIGVAESLYQNGQSMDDLSIELRKLAGLSAGSINVLARASVPLDHAVLVLVGDKTQILKQITGMKLPKPVIVEDPGG